MDMGSGLGTILGTKSIYKRDPMSTVKGPLIWLTLTATHMMTILQFFGGLYRIPGFDRSDGALLVECAWLLNPLKHHASKAP